MYLEKPIKIVGKRKSRRRLRTIIQLICLVIAFLIYLVYSVRLVRPFLLLIVFTLLKLRTVSGEQYYVMDAMCRAVRENDGLRLEIYSDQRGADQVHCVPYACIRNFTIEENGLVLLEYLKEPDGTQVAVKFSVHLQDQAAWEEFVQKPILYRRKPAE
jgi:hypothetical protein